MNKEKIKKVQNLLKEQNLDGWLLFDFAKKNNLACSFLNLAKDQMITRRFFYFIPQKGTPVKIVHAIESHLLDKWPGEKKEYFSFQELEGHLKKLGKKSSVFAMEYSPYGEIPYMGKVDAGTIQKLESLGYQIASSQNILPYFTSVLTAKEISSQKKAAKILEKIVQSTWDWMGKNIQQRKKITEYDVQQYVLALLHKNKMQTEGMPICGVNQNSADPHYNPLPKKSKVLKKGDWVLLDLWGKLQGEKTVFADITRVAFIGKSPNKEQKKIFTLVKKARDAALLFIQKRIKQKKRVQGFEVDQVCRKVIVKAGYGKYFLHKTGHSIEFVLHGSGAHLDSIETMDKRFLLPRTCFSVEPGIYLPKKFGVRLELDVLLFENRMEITGGVQQKIYLIE